jgi:hypothetical protein
MILMAQYQYRLNENQLKDNWGNSRWDVNNGSATSASNVSVVRERVAIPSIRIVGYLPLLIVAFIAIVAILWCAVGVRVNLGGR